MADIESALYSILTGAGAVTALVSTRVYPVMAAQSGSGDYIRYAKVDGQPYHTMEGAGGLRWGRFSFLCHGSTWSAAKAIAAVVLSTLDGYTGTVTNVSIKSCLSEEEVDLEYDDQARLYGRAVDFMIQWTE
jgi:hypothetical protein